METQETQDKMVILEEPESISLEARLKEQLFEKEQEVLVGKMTLMSLYPQIDDASYAGEDRYLGRINHEKFITACGLNELVTGDTDTASRLFELWKNRIFTLFYNNGAEEEIPIQEYEGEELRAKHGEDPYWMIRKAFLELRMAVRTGCEMKPWNDQEEREATLAELLGKLEDIFPRQ